MDQGQIVKQLPDGKPGERRTTGRHRLRWLDDVEAALRTMGIKRWRLIAKDRTELAGIIRRQKPYKECKAREKKTVTLRKSNVEN
jgi:hypothetical protein